MIKILLSLHLYDHNFMNIRVLANRRNDILRKFAVRFYDCISNLSLAFTEQTHKCNIDIAVTQAFGNIGHNAGSVLMNHDHCTVLACKVYLYVIDIYNTDLASSKIGRASCRERVFRAV